MKRTYIHNKRKILHELVAKQKGKCYWCVLPFRAAYDIKCSDMYVTKWTKPILDHYIPWSYNEGHGGSKNFVASCEIYNQIKNASYPIIKGDESFIKIKILERFMRKLKRGKIIIFDEDLKNAKELWKQVKFDTTK